MSSRNDDFEFIDTGDNNDTLKTGKREQEDAGTENEAGKAQMMGSENEADEAQMIDLEEVGKDESKRAIEDVMYGNGGHHHHHHHHHHHKKKHRVRKVVLIIIGIILLLMIICIAAFMIMSRLGKNELLNYEDATISAPEDVEAVLEDDGKIVTYNGKKYSLNENVASIVFMGVDKSELGTETYGDAGQADAVYIYTYDTVTKESRIITVSRETMVEVNLYSTSGKSAGIETMQLCLAYAYGDGRETSCENTLKSVSRIFYNMPFENYVALDWDAIAVLNDAVGGVEVEVLEDVYELKEGETVTLYGDDAYHYVQYRDTSYLTSNSNRLARQKQYITNFANKVITETKSDLSTPLTLYGIATDYMVTNISANQVSYIASEIIFSMNSMSDVEFLSIEGETVQGEEHAEFYPDTTQLYELILDVFYTEAE